MALAVMFNNFFHDLTAAMWLCSAGLIWWLMVRVKQTGQEQIVRFFAEIFDRLFVISLGSLVLNLVLGLNRAMAFYRYEYVPAAGQAQIIALVLKHVLIFVVVFAGVFVEIKAYRLVQTLKAGELCGQGNVSNA